MSKIAPSLLGALAKTFHSKCAYCESPVRLLTDGTFDHFRPKAGALNLDGSFSPDHYWWLYAVWENVYLACWDCNRLKGNRFPVKGPRSKKSSRGKALLSERAQLLDPCVDKPEHVLFFSDDGLVSSNDERGRTTIDILELNRPTLIATRKRTAHELRAQWTTRKAGGAGSIHRLASKLTAPSLPFLALRRQLVARWLEALSAESGPERRIHTFDAALAESISQATKVSGEEVDAIRDRFKDEEQQRQQYSLEDATTRRDYFVSARFIERVEIRNFRIIDQLDLAFPVAKGRAAPWLMLLGENGTGKSSVLQAIALALMSERARRNLKLNAADFVRHGCRSGSVRVHLSGSREPVVLTFRTGRQAFVCEPAESKVLLLAYGATRLLPSRRLIPRSRRRALERFTRVDNLFDPFSPLTDAEGFLRTTEHFEMAALALKDLLVLRNTERIEFGRGRPPQVQIRAGRVYSTLREMSDGFQSVVALAADIISVLSSIWRDDVRIAEGIVLVDELGAHLHPRWKMEIVTRLQRVFPRVQFIATTHDPLCLRGLREGEVATMRKDERSRIFARTDLPSPEGLRVDQLLTSEHFGLNSTIDPALDTAFETYYRLLTKHRRTSREEAELREVRETLNAAQLLGQTVRERMMIETADAYVAKRRSEPGLAARRELDEEAHRTLLEIWESTDPDGATVKARAGVLA